jgi:hypothetical protein
MAKDGTEEIEAGLVDEGGMIDEESGNDVPNGALKEEVRDDQPAMLSPGEFVMPAYAVRYFGVENLVKMLRAAKQGMEQLDDLGLTGEPNSNDAGLETAVLPSEMQEKGATPTLAVGGMPTIKPGAVTTTALTNQPTQQTQFGVAPPAAIQPAAQPAAVQPLNFAAPSPLTQQMYRPTAPIRFPGQQNVTYPEYIYSPTPGGTGYGVAEYVGPNGQSIFVTTINGKPIGQIPEGYVTRADYTKKQEEDKTTTPPTELQRKPEDMDPGSFEAPKGEGESTPQAPATSSEIQSVIDALSGKDSKSITGEEIATAVLSGGASVIPAIVGRIASGVLGPGQARNIMARSGSQKYDKDEKYTKEQLVELLEEELEMTKDAEKGLENLKGEVSGGRPTFFGGRGDYKGTTLEGIKFGEDEDALGKLNLKAASERAGRDIEAYEKSISAPQGTGADPSVAAPGEAAPGGGVGGSGYSGVGGGWTPFSKGGLISMANGGMITVGDKTYSPEDFGFASKGALVKKRKTPAKKKRGKGLASSK